MVATFVGSIGFAFLAAVTMGTDRADTGGVDTHAGRLASHRSGLVVLLPAVYVLSAVLGTFRSSVWTIGYVTQVPQVES